MSQESKLLEFLKDGLWHETPAILANVYGNGHLGIARIGARCFGLKQKGYRIESKKINGSVWGYRLVREVLPPISPPLNVLHTGQPAELFQFKTDPLGRKYVPQKTS